MVTCLRLAWVEGPVSPLTVLTCIGHGRLPGDAEGKGMLKAKAAKTALLMLNVFLVFPYSQENC